MSALAAVTGHDVKCSGAESYLVPKEPSTMYIASRSGIAWTTHVQRGESTGFLHADWREHPSHVFVLSISFTFCLCSPFSSIHTLFLYFCGDGCFWFVFSICCCFVCLCLLLAAPFHSFFYIAQTVGLSSRHHNRSPAPNALLFFVCFDTVLLLKRDRYWTSGSCVLMIWTVQLS